MKHSLIYIVKHGQRLYWNTCGWGSKAAARRYDTPAQAEPVLRRIMLDNQVKPKIEPAQ